MDDTLSEDEYVPVLRVEDLAPGHGRTVKIGGKTIAVFNVRGHFFAINNICPHQGGPLVKGKLKGYVVSCPWHDLQFDVRNGFGADGGGQCVASYKVRTRDGHVLVSTKTRDVWE